MRRPGERFPGTYQGELMKKTTKKLELSKETLRSLEEVALEKVAGGYSVYHCDSWRSCPNMPNTTYNGC